MATVTDLEFYMDDRLKEKLDIMIQRCTKRNFDNLLVIDGNEGYGKTTMSISVAYYISHETGRKFDINNIFFDVEKLIDFAVSTDNQIILWDEAALGGLSDQFQSKIQRKLLQLLMVARKKRHFWIFNIPKFFKLREYIILDRAVGLINIYARNEIELGRFRYYKTKNKERLYYDFKRSKQRNYEKYYSFHGTFGDHLAKQVDEAAYDKKKDEAIMSIGADEKLNPVDVKLINTRYHVAMDETLSIEQKEKILGVKRREVNRFKHLRETHPQAFKTVEVEADLPQIPKEKALSGLNGGAIDRTLGCEDDDGKKNKDEKGKLFDSI